MRRWGAALGAVLVAAMATACNVPPAGRDGPPAAGTGSDGAAAKQYCEDQGGALVDRQATWNTNADPAARLRLANTMTLCEFDGTDGTRISVDLVTLYSTEPTLAAIAYLSKVPPVLPATPSDNPAAWNCDEGLGGTSDFGTGVAGGGWVNDDEPVFKVMDLCVFADMSAIDQFGILYYATGVVRGTDLATKLRYQPGNRLPAIFGR